MIKPPCSDICSSGGCVATLLHQETNHRLRPSLNIAKSVASPNQKACLPKVNASANTRQLPLSAQCRRRGQRERVESRHWVGLARCSNMRRPAGIADSPLREPGPLSDTVGSRKTSASEKPFGPVLVRSEDQSAFSWHPVSRALQQRAMSGSERPTGSSDGANGSRPCEKTAVCYTAGGLSGGQA